MKRLFLFVICSAFFLVGCAAPKIVHVGNSYKPAGKIEAQKVKAIPVSFRVTGIPEWLSGGKGIKAQKDTVMCGAWPLQMNIQPGLSTTIKAMLSEVYSNVKEETERDLIFNFQILDASAVISGGGNEALVGYKGGLVGITKIVLKLQILDSSGKTIFRKIVEGESNSPITGQTCDVMYDKMGDIMKQSIEEALSTLAISYFNSDEFKLM